MQLVRRNVVLQAVEHVVQCRVRYQDGAQPVVDGALRHLEPLALLVERPQPFDDHAAGQRLAAQLCRLFVEIQGQEAFTVVELGGYALLRGGEIELPCRDRFVVQLGCEQTCPGGAVASATASAPRRSVCLPSRFTWRSAIVRSLLARV